MIFTFGILVKNYANNMDYPQVRRIGFDFRYTFSGFRLEFLHSDLKQFNHASLVGIRTTIPIVEKFDIGISITSDVDQINGLLDTDSDSYPDYVDAYINLGMSLEELQHIYEAKKYYELALNLDPNKKKACFGYGRILLELNQHNKALAYIEKGAGIIKFTQKDFKII